MPVVWFIGPPVDLSIGPPVDLSVGRPVCPSVDPSVDLSVGSSVIWSTDNPMDRSADGRKCRRTSQPTDRFADRPDCEGRFVAEPVAGWIAGQTEWKGCAEAGRWGDTLAHGSIGKSDIRWRENGPAGWSTDQCLCCPSDDYAWRRRRPPRISTWPMRSYSRILDQAWNRRPFAGRPTEGRYAPRISRTIASAAERGSGAWHIGRPTTMWSAPFASAAAGVAIRF